MLGRTRWSPAAVRSPVRNSWSRSSASDVSRDVSCACVRAITRQGTLATSAASRAELSVLMCSPVGTSTRAPRWPSPRGDGSRSPKSTPAAPASIIVIVSSNGSSSLSPDTGPPDRWTACRPACPIRRGVGAGDRAERPHRVLAAEQLPQPPGAAPRQGVICGDRAAQPDHIFGAVVAPDPGRALACLPLALKAPALVAEVAHVNHVFLIWCGRPGRLALGSACGATIGLDIRAASKLLQFFPKWDIDSVFTAEI